MHNSSAQRVLVVENLGELLGAARKQQVDDAFRFAFIEDLRLAVYCACLASFAQGLNLIARASEDETWRPFSAKGIAILEPMDPAPITPILTKEIIYKSLKCV